MMMKTRYSAIMSRCGNKQQTGVDDAVDGYLVLGGHVPDDREHGHSGVDRREEADHVDHQRVSSTVQTSGQSDLAIGRIAAT